MQDAIYFPHFGIYMEHVGKSVSVFKFEIAYYGILIGAGILLGIVVTAMEARRTRQNVEDYFDLVICSVIFSIIGARLYYVIFSGENYKGRLLSILNLREGGLAIYGGIIAAVITVFVFSKVKGLSFAVLLDTAVLGLVLGQFVGRWGNFFNREAFGEYTDSLFAMQLPVDAVRSSYITDQMRMHMENIAGVNFIQVHPTFFYESIWCLVLFFVLLLYRHHKKFEGEVFLIYAFGYGVGRIWIEGLRTDQLILHGLGWPVSQVLAGICIVVSVVLIIQGRMRARRSVRSRSRHRK